MSYRDESPPTSINGQRSSSSSSSEFQGRGFSKVASAFVSGGSDSTCKECGNHVYEMEKIVADQIVYHKSCFRCTQCKRLLNASTFTSIRGTLYCKPHFIELSRTKGQHKNEDDKESGDDSDGEETLDTPPLPVVKDMKGLFETHSQSSSISFSPQVRSRDSDHGKCLSKLEKSSKPPHSVSPVNHADTDNPSEDSDILPPADITRNLVAKFRLLERGDGSDAPAVPQPIRQFAPSRESPERSKPVAAREPDVVVRSGDPAELEDELPPPRITRDLIAVFGSRTSAGDAAAVSVERRYSTGVGGRSDPVSGRRRPGSFPEQAESANGGVFENQPEENFDVVRETDRIDETDLPEAGMARALVAQWKSLQMEVEKSRQQSPPVTSSRPLTLFSSSRPPGSGKVELSNANHDRQTADLEMKANLDEAGSIQTEETPEDELPPQDITRNLLAKFKMITSDQLSAPSQTPSKKQFKWDVKEARPVNYPGLVSVSKTSSSGDGPDQDETSEEELSDQDDVEKPHPAYTKIMLQKFQSMETS